MGELEFAEEILNILDTDLLQMTIKKAAAKGFTVPGFSKNVWLAPKKLMCGALGKKIKGKYQFSIFLEALCGLDQDYEAVCLTKKWMQNGAERLEAEDEIQKIQIHKAKQQKELEPRSSQENCEEADKESNADAEENERGEEDGSNQNYMKQQARIKKLQGIIQEFKIKTEDQKKEIGRLQKQNVKLQKQNEEKEECNIELYRQLEALKEEIKQLHHTLKMNEQENLRYQEIFQKAPRVICFSKKMIDKEMFPFYQIEQLRDWKEEYEKEIHWNDYREVWLMETDFNYSDVVKIKKLPCKKFVLCHNVKSLIDKVGGIR